jgi:tetratricopeptide (TPR) repeat protein
MARGARLAVGGLAAGGAIACWALVLHVSADVIQLNDGSKVEGEIVRRTDTSYVVKSADGGITSVDASKVKSLEAKRGAAAAASSSNTPPPSTAPTTKPAAGSPDSAMLGLMSLRRSVENQTDARKILERYRKFIEQHVGSPAGDEAVRDAQVWEDRLDKGMVKVGDRWLSKAAQTELHAKSVERAEAARQQLLKGHLREATVALDAALAENPQNAAAQYLRGIVYYRQQQPLNARKAFEAVAQWTPNHAPTLNNLAVLMWGAKQHAIALNYYGQAMNAAPYTQHVLDNVAEALNDLPQSQRDNEVTKKAVLLFNAQDMTLQGRLKKQGLHRWGSTWVKDKQLETLRAEEKDIEGKLGKMNEEFEQVQDRLEQIGRDIADTERSIRRIEASSYGRDSSGRPIRLSYPKLYYDLKDDLEQLQTEKQSETDKSGRLRKAAKVMQGSLSVPRYTGLQQIIGAEGAPDLPDLAAPPASPTTQTATTEPSTTAARSQ